MKYSQFVHVQSVLPLEDVVALKEKSKESSVKEAISKAVYHYLECELADKNCLQNLKKNDGQI